MDDTNGGDNDGVSITRRDALRAWAAAAAVGVAGATLPEQVAAQAYEDGVTVNEIWTDVLSRLPDNWGKWGADDEIGTLNYLDGEQAFRGMQAAMRGPKDEIEVFTLQPPYSGDVIPTPDAGDASKTGDPVFPTRQPARRDQVVDDRHYDQGIVDPLPGGMKFSDDAFITRLFLQGSAQADAVAHIWYDTKKRPGQDELADEPEGLLYNGFSDGTLSTPHQYDETVPGLRPAGDPENDLQDTPDDFDPFSTDLVEHPIGRTWEASRVGVENQAEHGSVGRAVLLDVGRNGPDDLERSATDETRLAQGVGVSLEDLKATADEQGVEIRERDVLLLRFGGTEKAKDPDAVWTTNEPGLRFTQDLVEWIDDMEIPLVAGDNLAVEVLVGTIDPQADLHDDLREEVEDALDITLDEPFDVTNPIHPALITNLGLPIHEIFLFDELSEACAQDGVYSMLYVGAPLNVVGGDGAPINPTVVKASRPADDDDDGEEEEDDDDEDDDRGRGGGGGPGPAGPERGGGGGNRPWWWDGDDDEDDD
jgi:kynurenine formamidase